MRSSFYDPIIFLLRPKMSSSSNGHIQVNFYPILMAIIAFCAKSVNNPKTLLLSLGRCMEGREEKKRSLRTKRGKIYQLMILLFFWFVGWPTYCPFCQTAALDRIKRLKYVLQHTLGQRSIFCPKFK